MCTTCGCASQNSNTQIKFFVKGYNADNANIIESALMGLTGVYHVHIHVHDGETTIDYNPEKTKLSDIIILFSTHHLEALI